MKKDCYKHFEKYLEGDKYPPGYLLWQLSNLWQRFLKNKLEITGLTNTQFALLKGLYHAGEHNKQVTQVELAHFMQINVMMASQVLRKLERKKFIKRVPHPIDTRAKCLELTEEGKKIIEANMRKVLEANAEFFEPIDGEFDKIYDLLKTLIEVNKHKVGDE